MSHNSLMKKAYRAGYTEKCIDLPGGTRINYGESASNGRPPALLIHGQTGAWQDYAPVLTRLARDYHVFAVDCPGHGKSGRYDGGYTAKRICGDLALFIENVIKAPATVSGHSSGGLLAAFLAAKYPALVSGLVLEDPPFFSTERGGRWEKSFAYVDTYQPMHRFLNQKDAEDWVLFYLENAYWGRLVGEKPMKKLVEQGKKYRRKHPGKPLRFFYLPDSLNNMFRFMDDYDLRFGDAFYDSSWFEGYNQQETLGQISCPAVLIHTKWSVDENGILMAAMSGDDAAKAQGLIEGCRMVNIDSGHNSHAEKPEEFLNAFGVLRGIQSSPNEG